jgi:hypothetical protein
MAGWLGVAVALAAPAFAEDAPRRVGSLNYVSGEVSYVLRAEPGEPNESNGENWLQADFDQPVCQDMSLKTGAMARARVRIGPDAIQMSDDTWLNVLNLTDQLIEASIRYGRIYLQLNKLDPGESVELEMPRGSLWLLQPGAYDIETGAGDQPTRIVVFEGKARFVGGAADLPIGAGKAVQISGNYPAVATTESDWTGINPAAPASDERPSAQPANTSTSTPSNPAQTSATSPRPEIPSTVVASQTAVRRCRPPRLRQPHAVLAPQQQSAHRGRCGSFIWEIRHRYRRFRTEAFRRISVVGRAIRRGSAAAIAS